jgi:hypothetical protein
MSRSRNSDALSVWQRAWCRSPCFSRRSPVWRTKRIDERSLALAKGYHRVGDLEGSARAVGEYLAICPAMTSTLRQQIEKEILPIEWSIVLNALDPGVRAI